MKRIESVFLLVIILLLFNYIAMATPPSYVSDAKTDSKHELDTKYKFEPWLWDKIQALQSNGTMENLSLIIRLVKDQNITGMKIGDLKNYAAFLFTENNNATIYSICNVLPVVMAKVSVAQAESIAAYEFVESIGDGDRRGYVTLNVSRPAIRADDVEAVLGYDGNGRTIAILDTGIDSNHPDLNDLDDDPATNDSKVIDEISFVDLNDDGVPDPGPPGEPMDYLGHGTHVAGIAAGTGEASNYQYNGTAPGAWLMNIKIAYLIWTPGGPTGTFENDDVINGIEYAISQGADVISMSINFPDGGDGTSELAKAADDAVDEGVVVVVAAGNTPPSPNIQIPGDGFNVITVGAVDDNNTIDIGDDTLAGFSSRGPTVDGRPKPDVVAPGVNIIASMTSGAALWQTYPDIRVGNFYAELYGTSMATPHVSGAVAVMLEANPNLTPAQVKAILRQTARLNDNLSGLGVNDRGYGIIDAYAAVQLAQNTTGIDIYQMYDGFDVTTPNRILSPLQDQFDFLTFTVYPPIIRGISLYEMDYHYRNFWGAGGFDYRFVFSIYLQHVWIDDIYYNLGDDMHKYLFSGPRITEKGQGYVELLTKFRFDGVFVDYECMMHADYVSSELNYQGGSSWKTLIYIDPDVLEIPNYPYLPSTDETIYYERKVTGDVLVNVRDLGHSEHVQIDPEGADDPIMWILYYDLYFGNNPDTSLDDEYVYDRDVVVYYQGTSNNSGLIIYRTTESLPEPDPPPATPSTPSGPTSGYTYTTYTYTTSATDPHGGSINYQFDWGDGTRTWTGWHASGDNASNAYEWSSPGTYCVRVRAVNYFSAWSDWSPILTVSVRNPDLTVLAEDQYGSNLTTGDVYIDDELVGYTGSTFSIVPGIHTIWVYDFWESGDTGCRYWFKNWTDGSADNPKNITVVEDTTVTAFFFKKWCPGDVNGDGKVDIRDVSFVSRRMGSNRGDPNWDSRADLYRDNKVNTRDLTRVTRNFGRDCQGP